MSAAPRPRVVAVIGSAGSGKNAVCQVIVREKTRYAHLSTGDMCREEVVRKTELGGRLAPYVESR